MRHRRLWLAILALAAVTIAVVLAYGTASPGATPYTCKVEHIPPANGKRYARGEKDTRVTVTYRYSELRAFSDQFLFGGINSGVPSKDGRPCRYSDQGRLVDENGNEYTLSSQESASGKIGTGRYRNVYAFPLHEVPLSAGAITLRSHASNCRGWYLPIAVVVRAKGDRGAPFPSQVKK